MIVLYECLVYFIMVLTPRVVLYLLAVEGINFFAIFSAQF